jgi:hypothetical protein
MHYTHSFDLHRQGRGLTSPWAETLQHQQRGGRPSSMTVAAVDRLVHYYHIVEISGDSHRRADADRRAGRRRKEPG